MPSSIENFLAHFSKVKKLAKGWQVRCPAHDDRQASLSIAVKNQKILFKCHAGCDYVAILDKIGLKPKDLFLISQPVRAGKPHITATYDYTDKDGRLLFQAVRFEPKDFRQRRPDPVSRDGWTWNLKGVDLVPYRLPDILKVSSVFIVEGEKDAESLWSIDLTATCNPMGAGKWRPEFSKYFEGKEVFILPDLDEPGRKHAADVAEKLFGRALKIKIVELPITPGVKDIFDWLAYGGKKKELLDLVKQAKEWQPSATKLTQVTPGILQFTKKLNQVKESTSDIEWLAYQMFPRGYVSIIAGEQKHGKTWVALEIATALSKGRPIFGLYDCSPCKVLFIEGDTGENIIKCRLEKAQYDADSENFIYVDGGQLSLANIEIDLGITDGRNHFEDLITGVNPDFVMLDSLHSFHNVDENKGHLMKPIFKYLKDLAQRLNIHIDLTHHVRKQAKKEEHLEMSANDIQGSNAILKSIGMSYGVRKTKTKDDEELYTFNTLLSWFAPVKPVTFKLTDDPETEQIEFVYKTNENTAKMKSAREYVKFAAMNLLRCEKEMTLQRLHEELLIESTFSERTYFRALDDLEQVKKITRRLQGKETIVTLNERFPS